MAVFVRVVAQKVTVVGGQIALPCYTIQLKVPNLT